MSWLEVQALSKSFGDTQALRNVDFAVAEGEFMCIVGPTNAGKSTLLKTIAGLNVADDGHIRLAGRDITHLAPRHRRLSLLFQNIALFPALSGFENLAFPLKARGASADDVGKRVASVAGLLRITHILDRLPKSYSGGEQQRVAIGRAIIDPQDLLMMDEPLTNLDARLRIAMRVEFKAMREKLGQTFLYVTHDQVEALSLADRILVLNGGVVQQIGTPDDIYDRPADRFVAQFFGVPPMNFIAGEFSMDDNRHWLAAPGFRVAVDGAEGLAGYGKIPRSVELGVRPENMSVGRRASEHHPIMGVVNLVERLGSKNIVSVDVGGKLIKAIVPPDEDYAERSQAWLGFAVDPRHLLDPQTGRFFH